MWRAMTSSARSGYSLIEVLIASAVFLFGVASAYTGIGFVTNITRDANSRSKAVALAHTVASNLMSQGFVLVPGDYSDPNQLLADGLQIGNRSQELICNGSSYYPFCSADYPRAGANFLSDLNRALGMGVTISGSGPEDYEILFQGTYFRVHWNVVDNAPVQGQKTVSVIVTWRPYGGLIPETHAVMRGRYVQLTFIKGRAL